jgi:hypothetical protein
MPSYVYSSCNPITTGCYLYTDVCLTTAASTGAYSDGTDCFTVTSGGYVSSVESCSPPTYTVDLYARHGASASPNAIDIYWSTNDISYTFAATRGVSTTCTQLFPSPSIDITSGGTVYIKVQDASLASYVYFNANDGTGNNCPSNADTYCTYSFVVNSNTSVNVTSYNNPMFGDFTYC